jgi:hypothetical protein
MPSTPKFTLDYTLDLATRRQTATELMKQFIRRPVVIIYAAAILALAAFFAYSAYSEYYDWADAAWAGIPMLCVLVAFFLAGYIVTRIRLREIARKFPQHHYEFFDTYFIGRTRGTEGKIDYTIIDKLIITKAGHLLKLNRQFFFLPTQSVTPELAKFLKSKLPVSQRT